MSRSIIKQDLQHAYSKVLNNRLDGFQYEGKGLLEDVVWDIIDTESYIVGIADKILDNYPSDAQEIIAIDKQFYDGINWRCTDGTYYSINSFSEIIEYAKDIEELRRLCKTYFQS